MHVSDVPHTGLDAHIHHGVISAAIESIASIAAAAHLGDRGNVVGVSNTTSHFLGVSAGTLDVVAEPVSRLDDRQLWTVRVTDETGELLARGDVQLANVRDADQLGSRGHGRAQVSSGGRSGAQGVTWQSPGSGPSR